MTEWSKLLHQLNSISPSLKDPVKLAHISGHHHPFPTQAAYKPKAAQHPRLSSAPAASRLWRRLIGNTLVYTVGVDGERRRQRGQRQRHRGRWKLLRRSNLRNRDSSCICDKNMILKQRDLWQHSRVWGYYWSYFSSNRNSSFKQWNKNTKVCLRFYLCKNYKSLRFLWFYISRNNTFEPLWDHCSV